MHRDRLAFNFLYRASISNSSSLLSLNSSNSSPHQTTSSIRRPPWLRARNSSQPVPSVWPPWTSSTTVAWWTTSIRVSKRSMRAMNSPQSKVNNPSIRSKKSLCKKGSQLMHPWKSPKSVEKERNLRNMRQSSKRGRKFKNLREKGSKAELSRSLSWCRGLHRLT